MGNYCIRKIVIATGAVTTFAGNGTSGFPDGTGTAARFAGPKGIAADGSGNLYVADMGNYCIRKIVIATGEVTTFAGGTPGDAVGTGTGARFNQPCGIAAAGGNLYVADTGNNRIRTIVIATGVVTTLAGNGTRGEADGTGTAAQFDRPRGITVDGSGNRYVADYGSHRIRKITP
jgi:sugar lactone lactonase YvrE